MKKILPLLLFIILLLSNNTYAQVPANNDCTGAQNLAVGAVPACGTGNQTSANLTVAGNITAATPGNPYIYQTGCLGASATQAFPANDVWYKFVATGFHANISVASTFANPNIAFYSGTCASLGGGVGGCVTGTGGTASITIDQLIPGNTYYIQVSGGTSQTGTFNLTINNWTDCTDCLQGSVLTVSPLPVNGAYPPNTTVQFCFQVTQYNHTNTNWLHGVQVTYGSGWNPASLVANVPTSPSTGGSWSYYPTGIGIKNGVNWGPGWYWETVAGQNNPKNNFGDPATNTSGGSWTYCITLTTASTCSPGSDLGVTFNTSGDGESGSWSNTACSSDAPSVFHALGACCPPTMSSLPLNCNGINTGSATATPVGTQNPYTYNWTGPGGYTSTSSGVAGANTISNVAAGIYTVQIIDKNLCPITSTVQVTQPTPLVLTLTPANASCSSTGSISAAPSGGTPAYTYTWTGPGGYTSNVQNPTGLTSAGVYTLSMKDSKGCIITQTTTVASSGTVTSTFTGAGTQCLNGNTFTFTNTGSSGAGINHAYTFAPAAGAPGASPTNTVGTYGPVSFTTPGTYTVTQTVTSGVCVSTTTAIVTINPNPLATLTSTNPTCGNSNGQVFINNTSCCAQTISTFASSLGAVSGQTVTGLGAGTPIITLTNSFGCTYTVSTVLTMIPGPTGITITPTNATCGNNNGSFTFGSPVGGTSPYTYAINGGAFSATSPTTGLAPGTYSVTVKDANGCLFPSSTTISNIAGPTAIAGTSSPASCAGATGSYTVTGVTGGTAAYTYSLDGGAFSGATTFSGLASGTHTITVKDANGCIYTTTFSVGVTAGITSAVVNASTASCGQSNATATVSAVTGGVPTYSYSYDGGAYIAGSTTSGLAAGNHTVVIKDANTCTLTVLYTVISLGSPTTSVTSFSNVTCFGLANGSCTVAIPTGGAGAPFTYSLTAPLQTNGNGQFSGLAPGTYNISVKDVAGCVATTSVVITQPTQVSITPSSIAVKCFGTATGTINVTGAGGTPGYTYNLNGGAYQASTAFPNQSAGSYLMGIKDANGCTATQTITVTQPTALAISVSTQNANCTAANGVATASVSGGTPGFITYTWTPTGGAAATSNSVAAGNYTVTATDPNGCVISSPVTIGVTLGGTAAITASTNITCNGLCNGSMTAGMTGGTAPYTYSWTPGGQTTAVASSLCPGTYSCTITDFFGCKSTAFGTITQPSVLTAIMSSQNVKCYNTPTGTVSVAGSGGQPPYIYSWPTLASTLTTVSNVASGNYNCITTDANGCSITTSITVTQPTSITLTSSVTAANCNLPNGSATITVSGGIPAYTQTWSASGSPTTAAISGQLAGTYSVQIKDANNCLQALTVTIPNVAGPSISITSQTNVSCYNGNNGVATTSVTGGVAPYIYTWSNGLGTPNGTNLTAQLYTVSATDQAGCVTSTSVNITQPIALTVTISATQPKCFGATNGLGTAAAFGGTPNYSYAWTAGGNASITTPLGAGNYGLTVTDGNGCVITSSMVLTNPPAMAASITSTNVTCFNACNGLAIATSTNGIGAVSYVWTGGASPVSSQTLTGACIGSYTVLATDQNACTANAVVNITQPTQVTANITSTGSVTCYGGNNGFAVVTPSGGTGAYSYTWSPSGGNAATASTLVAGSYVATVADALGCSATATANIIQPAAFTTTLTTTNVKCNAACDGTGNIAFTGGVGLPTFLWQPGLQSGNSVNNLCAGNQTVTITSNGSCTTVLTFTLTEPSALTAVVSSTNSNCGQANGKTCVVVSGGTSPYNSLWSNGITTMCNNNIIAGPYTYTVTDFNNCTAVVAGIINDIAGPVVTVTSSTNVSCFNGTDGAAITSVSGGVSPYTFMWAGAQTFTTQNVTGFNSGVKTIAVTDAAGCVGSASVTITQPTQLVSAIASFTNVTCFGYTDGGATILVNGGTPNYSYTWTPSAQTSSVLTGVGPNTYTCNIADGNGCLTSQVTSISQPQALVMAASSFSNVLCFGQANGQISTTVQGGTQAYSYTWTPAQSNSGVVNGLVAGAYALSVSDAHGCSISSNFTILEPSALTSTYTSLPATCGLSNGSATLTVGGGTPSYSINWNTAPPQTGLIASNMSPGTNWQAVITDAHGCSLNQAVTIANPLPPTITGFNVSQPTCFGLPNGTITVNYTDGTAPYTVNWPAPISQSGSTSALSYSVSGVSAGLYSVIVTDNYGCSTTQPVNVTQPNMLVLVPTPNVTICYGQSTQISASASGGTPAYTYSWTPNTLSGSGPHTVNPTTTTSYIVSVSDANGCTRSPQVITVAATPQLAMNGFAVTKCEGQTATLAPTITSIGNGGPYDFTWSNGVTTMAATSTSVSVLAFSPGPNQYTVSIDDHCTIPLGTAVFTINVNPLPQITFTANPRIGCAPLTVTLTGTSDGANDTFNWIEFGVSGNPKIVTISDTGYHQVTLFVTNPTTGCTAQKIEKDYIYVYERPIASFYADPYKASILDPNINFINTSQGATGYYWDFGDFGALNGTNNSLVTNPSHSYSYVGSYVVHLVATSIRGCKDTAEAIVEIMPDFAIYIPNAFTPDDNGTNDIFQPLGVGINEDNYRLDIFDRWGENVFTSNNFRKGWDGTVKGSSKPVPQGVYIYKLMVYDLQGNKHPFVGHVTVTRQN